MMVSWIKIEVILPDKPEVITLAKLLRLKDSDTVVGKLIRLWSWADMQTVDGNCVPCTDAFIDRTVFCKGFAKALRSVGWLEGKEGALVFPRFQRHNGETTKERIGSNRRVSRFRNRGNGRGVTEGEETGAGCNGTGVTDVTGEVLLFPLQKPLPNPLPEEEGEIDNIRGGGRIPRCMGGTPSGVAPPSHLPSVFSERVKGEDGKLLPEFVEFVTWAKGVRPGWDAGRLSRREQQAAAVAFLGLVRPVSELERIAVTEYLAHEPENGGKFDYPPDRELFFSIFQEVVQKAVAWFRRTGRKTAAEKEEGRRKAALAKLKGEEITARRLAAQYRHEPEELISELSELRRKYGAELLTNNELETIRKGNYNA
jgi:hypothetical protein